MAYVDHNTELPVYRMVLNRLPFVVDTPSNVTLLSHFTLEVMNELEPCFKARIVPETGAVVYSRVGNEEHYSVLQRSVIADIVAMYILLLKATETSGGSTAEGAAAPLSTFLKKAKAGSVEVEYDQFKLKDSTILAIGNEDLLGQLKAGAVRKAAQLGCIIDICDDCSINISAGITDSAKILPMITRNWDSGCNGCGG